MLSALLIYFVLCAPAFDDSFAKYWGPAQVGVHTVETLAQENKNSCIIVRETIMDTLSESDYNNWIESEKDNDELVLANEDGGDEIIFSDTDEIKRLEKELRQLKKKLKTKQEEVNRLKKRNELLTHLVRGKSIRLE